MGWFSEATGHGGIGGVEDVLALLPDELGPAEMHVSRGVEPDARVAVLVVVVLEEPVAERPGGGEVGEPLRESR